MTILLSSKIKTLIGLFLIFFFTCNHFQCVTAQTTDTLKEKDLINFSFEDLMNVQIKTGSLISIERSKVSSALIVITREEIENTLARNRLDLMEVHVPGVNFTNHWLCPRIGMRSVMSDQNNSFLLIVNDKNMKLQYDRGPISFTYRPGTIDSIISITTKKVETSDKVNVDKGHDLTYRYSYNNRSFSVKNKNFTAYLFDSIGTSDGINNPKLYNLDRTFG
jgi:hypothetical protein